VGPKSILVRGAREHNLKDVTVEIPRDRLVVVSGVSGSGKSSLAFDTVYAEGQRRYIESLSTYARQFLGQLAKPDVDAIEGLPPTLSIEQRSHVGSPRSTVATTTELYDFLRVLWARAGEAHCPKCGDRITQQTPQQIVDRILALPQGSRLHLLAPIVRGRKGEHKEAFERIKKEGLLRARVDGRILETSEVKTLDKKKKHDILAVADRLVIQDGVRTRVAESVEFALRVGAGLVVASVEGAADQLFSTHLACPRCDISLGELSPRSFSFNSPYGACPVCNGIGVRLEIDEQLLVPDPETPIEDGAIPLHSASLLSEFAYAFDADLTIPYAKLDERQKRILLHGTTDEDKEDYGCAFEGLVPNLKRRFSSTTSEAVKGRILGLMSELPCEACRGARLKPEALAVTIGGKGIHEATRLTIDAAIPFFQGLTFSGVEAGAARPVLKEVLGRLRYLLDVGLGYLTLDRRSSTLAGGEAQRIRLASQVGGGLVGVCYVLDEPTVGLHARDTGRLLSALVRLRDIGNTVIVVEHDEQILRAADHLIDVGPGAGAHGGQIVAQGSLEEVLRVPDSATAKFLRGELALPPRGNRRKPVRGHVLTVRNARENNLMGIDVSVPLGLFVCVTGVSGSGKSTLVCDVLHRGLARHLTSARERPGAHDAIDGIERLDKVINIDQSPIGRSSRSNPATYTGAFDEIRELFALTKEAKARGFDSGRFSFNRKGGRCEACEGLGTKVIEMHFLPDVHVTCDACGGKRYDRETLEVRFKGLSIHDVLSLRVEEARSIFGAFPRLARLLATLDEVGMGYAALGQPASMLSGGEAQRVKLAAELGRADTGRTLYILDEPTTGLHFADIRNLLAVLDRLVQKGNTVLVIEHHLEVIRSADWVIDLGPEGGDGGGRVVATGTPEEVAACPESHTGGYLSGARA